MDQQQPPAATPAPKPDRSKIVGWLSFALSLTAVILWIVGGGKGPPPVIPLLPEAAPTGTPQTFSMGWKSDQDAVKAVKATLDFPVFSDTPAGKDQEALPKSAYLWHAYRKIKDANPPPRNQNPVGSCVSFGTNRAAERSLETAVVGGQAFEMRRFVEEVTYAGSRVEVGGGRVRGDGSVGAWAAKYATTVGLLPEGKYGTYDLLKYDPNRCRAWGYSGVPADLRPEVARFKVGDVTQVLTWTQAKRALANGNGISVSSDVGFNQPGTARGYVEPAKRDINGACRPNGEWMHCMALDGYHTDENGKEWGHIEDSWGPTAHGGPVGWGEPNTAGFWTDSETINRMLAQGDSWAFSAVKGFPKQNIPLDWFTDARPPNAVRDHVVAFTK